MNSLKSLLSGIFFGTVLLTIANLAEQNLQPLYAIMTLVFLMSVCVATVSVCFTSAYYRRKERSHE